MALSLTTNHGLGYYAQNDVTSWLSGFNVLVLKLEEIITDLETVDEENKNDLLQQIAQVKQNVATNTGSIETINASIQSINQSISTLTNAVNDRAMKQVVDAIQSEVNSMIVTKGESRTHTIHTAGYVTTAGTDLFFTIPYSKPLSGKEWLIEWGGLTVRQNGKYLLNSDNAFPSTMSPTSVVYQDGIGFSCRLTSNVAFTGVTNNDVCSITTKFTLRIL